MRVTFVVHRPELYHGEDHPVLSWSFLQEPDVALVCHIKDSRNNGDDRRRDNEQDERAEAIKEWLKNALVQVQLLPVKIEISVHVSNTWQRGRSDVISRGCLFSLPHSRS